MKSVTCFVLNLLVFICIGTVSGQISEGLLIHYSLNGNINDISGNDYNGISNSTIQYASDYLGNAESALDANGTNTYVNFPELPALEVDFPLSLYAKVRFNSINGHQVVACTDFSSNSHSGAWLQVSSNGLITAAFGQAFGGFTSNARRNKFAEYNVEPGTWYDITAVFNGPNDIQIYIGCDNIDGYYEGDAETIGYSNQGGSLCRKNAGGETLYFDGRIDDFRYWNRALTMADITELCHSVSSISNHADKNQFGLELFPNPTRDALSLRVETGLLTDESSQLRIFDMRGQLVRNESIYGLNQNGTVEISIADLAGGYYSLQLVSDNLTSTRSFVKL